MELPPATRRTLIATLAGWPLAARAAPRTPGEVEVGQVLRDAPLHGLNGPDRRLSDYRGKPLLINVWASWCGPCRAETASLERLAWSAMGQRFAVIGVSTDDYPDRALAWLKRSNATFNHYIDRRLELENLLGASQLPLTVLVGADGRVLAKVVGAQEWDGAEMAAYLRKVFGPAARKR